MKQFGLYAAMVCVLIGITHGVIERSTNFWILFSVFVIATFVSQRIYGWRGVHRVGSVVAASLILGLCVGLHAPTEIPEDFLHALGKKGIYKGVVVSLPDVRETNTHLTIEIEEGGIRTRIHATAPTYPDIHVGDVVTVSGVLKKAKPFEGTAGRIFPYDMFLAKDNVFAVMSPAYVTTTGRSTSLWLRFLYILERVRTRSIAVLGQTLPEPESALAAGILIGGKQGLGKNLLDDFMVAGMLQIVVLSGYNVMIVAEGILRVLKNVSKKVSAILAGLAILVFVLVAGAGSSAVRAGIMALLSLVARATGRTYDVLRALLLALVLMSVWSPLSLVYDPGLQFSFMATLGLILGTPMVTEKIAYIPSSFVREMFATTIAAQLGVLPLLLWQTGNLSLISLFANVLAMPVLPFAMAASALAGVITFLTANYIPLFSILVGVPAYIPLRYVITLATVSAQVPYANIIVPLFSFWFVVIAYAVLGVCVWRYTKKTARSPDLAVFV